MSDVYNSKLARLLAKMNKAQGNYAVTTSATCTRYSCAEKDVSAAHRIHEDYHKGQIKRMGWLNFMATYLWQIMVKGYKYSELENAAPKINK